MGSKEFFINKAMGWTLRQYARSDPQAVSDFVAATPLHPLSKREAQKAVEAKTGMLSDSLKSTHFGALPKVQRTSQEFLENPFQRTKKPDNRCSGVN